MKQLLYLSLVPIVMFLTMPCNAQNNNVESKPNETKEWAFVDNLNKQFLFQNGDTGLIQVELTPSKPATKWDNINSFSIVRRTNGSDKIVFVINQNYNAAILWIGGIAFDLYEVSNIQWEKEGYILIVNIDRLSIDGIFEPCKSLELKVALDINKEGEIVATFKVGSNSR